MLNVTDLSQSQQLRLLYAAKFDIAAANKVQICAITLKNLVLYQQLVN